ncbi:MULTISPECIES: glycosyltransferase [unclassified Rathayibacter]|uniref:glycosyltransferase n=1 Tax=unclassified Rathayibacter TaxID=2609250 RepID=UPI000CE8CE98|nr:MULTISPECIES: glycosyltransferase [unclassified Rathayibacter]PPI40782.1 glycosyltransferase [Rathayibacter sp. RFBD1]PPI60784.1 glycosyltransferase [Rathayibacter sp. TRS19]QHF21673.1 glycosyltransferase [Rathayibacter sp. VKM Ac-2762]
MRIVFSANPLPGHLVPMIPLMRAARAAGHRVAVLTGADAAAFVLAEGRPDLEILPAGPPTLAAMTAMQEETGASPATAPDPATIAEFFAVRRVAETVDEAVSAARVWRPDLVISESLDHVGPYVAEALGVPFVRHTFGPERPEAVRTAIAAASARAAAARGVVLPAPAAWIDVYPAFLEDPASVRTGYRIPLRPSAHEAAGSPGAPRPAHGDRPRVLLTMGTVFTSQPLLDALVSSMERDGLRIDLVATAVNGVRARPGAPESPVRVENVPFRPLAELLADADAVVTVGGAGTVLAALVSGVPLVVMPLGADHAVNAARATAAGAAITVAAAEEAGPALRRVLEDDRFRASARTAAARIAALSAADEVLGEIEHLVLGDLRKRA